MHQQWSYCSLALSRQFEIAGSHTGWVIDAFFFFFFQTGPCWSLFESFHSCGISGMCVPCRWMSLIRRWLSCWDRPHNSMCRLCKVNMIPSLCSDQQGLTLSIWFTCPSGTWFWKLTCPAKIFTCPAIICTKPCKIYEYCWENKYMPWLKNHLPSWARNPKNLCALGQDLHVPGIWACLNVEPWSVCSCYQSIQSIDWLIDDYDSFTNLQVIISDMFQTCRPHCRSGKTSLNNWRASMLGKYVDVKCWILTRWGRD